MSQPGSQARGLAARALALRRSGELPEAIASYRQALALEPASPALRVNLALALRASGDLAAAAATCREALRLCPHDADAWNVLGLLLQEQEQPQAAATALRRALQLNPAHAEALSNLGHLLIGQGELEAALAACRRAIALRPELAEAWNNLAQALGASGQLAEAISAARRALALRSPFAPAALGLALLLRRQGGRPGLDEALELLGQLLAAPEGLDPRQRLLAWEQAVASFCDLERHAEAWRLAERALAAGCDSAELQAQLGRALAGCERFAEAEQAYQRALERQGKAGADLWLALGMLHGERGQAEPACSAYRRALALEPAHIPALHALAITLMNQGELEQARACCERVLELAPSTPENLYLASDLLLPERHATLQAALAAADGVVQGLNQQALLAFASARLQRRRGEHTAAIATLLEANRLQHAWLQSEQPSQPWDAATRLAEVQQREAVALALPPASCPQRLIFIVGLPRGGSTLLESILSCSPLVQPLGELKVLEPALREEPSCAAVAERYLAAAADRLAGPLPSGAVLVDKQLGTYIYTRIIPHLFPQARIVHVHRNPLDQLLSILWVRFTEQKLDWAYDLEHLVAVYDSYRRVLAHLQSFPELPLYHCNYDRLVQDPAGEIPRLVAFCGLPWQEEFLHPERSRRMVSTASVLQVRQPIHAGSVGGWRRYEAELRPLAERLEALGYATGLEAAP